MSDLMMMDFNKLIDRYMKKGRVPVILPKRTETSIGRGDFREVVGGPWIHAAAAS